jgi:hypothetical protein
MENNDNLNDDSGLKELSGSPFEIKDEQPDISDWKVKNDSDQIIGKVDELIFDPQALKVRYIVINVEDNEWGMDARKIMVPIGLAELDDENDHVILPGVTLDQILLLPNYDKDNLTAETETAVRKAFLETDILNELPVTHHSDDFYSHEHFNQERLFRRRRSGDSDLKPGDSLN